MILFESGFTGAVYPLDHPRIAAFPLAGTIVASSAAAGYDAAFAASGDYKAWRPTSVPATWELSFASATVSYIGIVGNLGSVGCTLQIQRWNGVAYSTVITHTPTDDSPILALLVPTAQDRYRVRFTNAVPTVQVIFGGAVIEVPQRAQFTGSVDFDLADQDSYRDNISDGGQVLDRFINRKSIPAMMDLAHLSELWVDTVLKPLRVHLKTEPFFMANRPNKFPNSVVFGLLSEPLAPQRAMSNENVSTSVQFKVSGHVST